MKKVRFRFAIFYPTDPNPSKNTINIESYSEKNYFDGTDDRVSVQVYKRIINSCDISFSVSSDGS